MSKTCAFIPEVTYLVTDDEDENSGPDTTKHDSKTPLKSLAQKQLPKCFASSETSVIEIDSLIDSVNLISLNAKSEPAKELKVFTSILNIKQREITPVASQPIDERQTRNNFF